MVARHADGVLRRKADEVEDQRKDVAPQDGARHDVADRIVPEGQCERARDVQDSEYKQREPPRPIGVAAVLEHVPRDIGAASDLDTGHDERKQGRESEEAEIQGRGRHGRVGLLHKRGPCLIERVDRGREPQVSVVEVDDLVCTTQLLVVFLCAHPDWDMAPYVKDVVEEEVGNGNNDGRSNRSTKLDLLVVLSTRFLALVLWLGHCESRVQKVKSGWTETDFITQKSGH